MRKFIHVLLATTLGLVALLAFPAIALADGGPILTDPELWASLKEGQQTAVIKLNADDTASVDLFVTMLDGTQQSHEIVYFVPLGISPQDFKAAEETSLDFDQSLTTQLDDAIKDAAQEKNNMRAYLLAPSAAISGGWMLPLYIPFALTGCASSTPESTIETESSSISIYGLGEDTDLEDLINTTGLDVSVKDTLSRLRGQKIAVITLQTRPQLGSSGTSSYHPSGQPGIHLSWTTNLVRDSGLATYSYPLGTGSAWSQPIDLTRVYVVAPLGLPFTVDYPRLGTDRSGYSFAFFFGQDRPLILGYYDTKAYAVDEASGSFGHIWRATYSQSNSNEDIVIKTWSKGPMISAAELVGGLNGPESLLIGLIVAALLWVAAWRYVIPRVTGYRYSWRHGKLWGDALACYGINTLATLLVLPVAAIAFFILAIAAGGALILALPVVVVIMLPVVLGLPAIFLYVRRQYWHTDWPDAQDTKGPHVSWRRTVVAYILVAVAANIGYLAFAFGFAALTGAL